MDLARRDRIYPYLATQLAAVWLVAGLGCGPEPPSSNDDPDAGADAVSGDADFDGTNADTGSADSATGGDTGDVSDVGGMAGCPTPMAVQTSTPRELEIEEWIYGADSGSSTSIRQALLDGSFELPASGEMKYGSLWKSAKPKENGNIPAFGFSARSTIYAGTTVDVDESTYVFARAEANRSPGFRIYVNGFRQPGGVYGFGDKRVPIPLEKGENTIVVRFLAARTPDIELFETPDEVYFNDEDTTAPQLRVGKQTNQPVGISVLNLTSEPMLDVKAKVVENQQFEATTVEYPSIGAGAVTQVAFQLKPKSAWSTADEKIPVTLRLESCATASAYEKTLELKTVEPSATFRRTFRSPIDGSAQYYAVVPPKNFAMGKKYGMTLTLHGASVEAEGQAKAYTQKEWTYIIAPTNRRRFGFDWEEWGHFNGMAALDHAMETFPTDPKRVYVTGHSMGGHGTWHFGIMHPGRFATVGPSAGWESFYTYGGNSPKPWSAIQNARAHSDTMNYMENLADRAGYIIHGANDKNVPPKHGENLRDALKMYTSDVKYHEEPGAGHWWNDGSTPGADCVNWPPLFEFMKNHQLDPNELDFKFKSPGPWYSAEHSYVTIRSSESPKKDCVLESKKSGAKTVELTTTNVRSMDIDGEALRDKGIETVVVDGSSKSVPMGTLEIGPRDGKRPGLNSTLNEVFRAPFCFVYPDDGAKELRAYASFLTSTWSIRGNGNACSVPLSQVDSRLKSERNLVYVGVPFDEIPDAQNRPFSWSDSEISIGSWSFSTAMAFILFPQGDRPAAAFVTTKGTEAFLFNFHPFSSRTGMPDYRVISAQGGDAAGFFDPEWKFDASLGAKR